MPRPIAGPAAGRPTSPQPTPRAATARAATARGSRSGRGFRAVAVTCVVAAIGATTGCAAAVSVPVAPQAADPICASVVLALPAELAAAPRRDTTSQATAAWGDPAAPIVLRCGVDPLPPTTEQCVTATDAAGVSVDWVAVEEPAGADAGASPGSWTFTTYGREPAVEVTVPGEVASVRSTSFLVDLGPAISTTSVLRTCL